MRLADSAHPAPPDVPLSIAPEEPRHHGEAPADGAGATLGIGRDRLREVGATLDRDVRHGVHMIRTVTRFVKADLI